MLAAMRHFGWLLIPLLTWSLGCDKKSDAGSAGVAPPSAAPEPTEKPKPEPVTDIDAKSLLASLECPKSKHEAACEVLDAFEKGKPWNTTNIRGDEARYFGKALVYLNDEVTEQWVFLVVKKIPLNEASPGDLPLRVALREIDKDRSAEIGHADKLLRLLERDDAVNKRNQTANYILDYTPSNWDSSAATKGASTIFHVGAGAFVREGPGRSIVVVQRDAAKPGAAAGDGMFVKLFPLSW